MKQIDLARGKQQIALMAAGKSVSARPQTKSAAMFHCRASYTFMT